MQNITNIMLSSDSVLLAPPQLCGWVPEPFYPRVRGTTQNLPPTKFLSFIAHLLSAQNGVHYAFPFGTILSGPCAR